jgi:hemerythrin superfamily protein
MFDWLLPEDQAIAVVKADHDKLRGLFEAFEKADTAAGKKSIVRQTLTELKLHAAIEEEIFYPAVRQHVTGKVMNEADEEHHVARVLVAELESGTADPGHIDAKFTVLAENVRHHMNEEEEQMLPRAQEMSIDLEALGRRMIARREELIKNGIPADREHAMVAKAGKKADTPAKAASRRAAPTRKRAHTTPKTAARKTAGRKTAVRTPAAKRRTARG